MFNEKFKEVLNHEGALSITTWSNNNANVTNTWNSYTHISNDVLLIPAAGMTSTQKDILVNNKIKLTLGSKEVEGTIGMGAGFYLEGTARFLDDGDEYNMMKTKFPFLKRVLEVTPIIVKQTI
ncbi:pyridoxamine 5'-phosphate oxidase family protein [Metaclostridioides mangenotii]|uniref:pyridoxamine 5'-phosphate oxidase family protein n=1 Tax=Metaclostridioides mangenotii TaxID=1540 RepID=UPI0004677716|nr:pyridoxamine 5'-phosphate oxidase family protein [Clostridioides mangenotii]